LIHGYGKTFGAGDLDADDGARRAVDRGPAPHLALTQRGENPVSVVLYPSVTESAQDQVVGFRGVLDGIAKARVILRPVHLLRLDRLLRAGSGVGAERGRQEMVAGLVRGEVSGWRMI
jgi:hypothetical protein